MSATAPFRIGISGSYGGLNLGDEAILRSIVQQLRASLAAHITVFSRNAADTARRHAVERAVDIRELNRSEARAEVARLDLLILGGGGLLYDRDAEAYLREVLLARELGVPVMVYAVSAGPLEKRQTREAVRDALSGVQELTVRDRLGKRLLEDIGVEREVQVTADPALLLEPEALPEDAPLREGLTDAGRRVAFSVREPGPAAPEIDVEHYHRLLANAADFMVLRFDAEVVFVPMERQSMDMQHSHAVIARMQCAQRASVLRGEYSSGQVLSLLRYFDFAVGMRLHFLIFAALQGLPFVALPYAPKVTGLLQALEIAMPPLTEVSAGRLIAMIDQAWDLRDEVRERVCQRLPALQERARDNHRLLMSLIDSSRHSTPTKA